MPNERIHGPVISPAVIGAATYKREHLLKSARLIESPNARCYYTSRSRGTARKSLNETAAFPAGRIDIGERLPYALFNRFPSGLHDFLSLIVRSQLTSGVLIVTYR